MKLVSANAAGFEFRLGKREKGLFLQLLGLYPRIPPAHHSLSRKTSPDPENQRLLNEALAEQRAQNKQQLESLLGDPARFKQDDKGALLSLHVGELEWLLQVLNDVRVGSWISLGSPEEISPMLVLDPEKARDAWSMEMCGYFQAHLLEGYESTDPGLSS